MCNDIVSEQALISERSSATVVLQQEQEKKDVEIRELKIRI
jgi:hypothetical protein